MPVDGVDLEARCEQERVDILGDLHDAANFYEAAPGFARVLVVSLSCLYRSRVQLVKYECLGLRDEQRLS